MLLICPFPALSPRMRNAQREWEHHRLGIAARPGTRGFRLLYAACQTRKPPASPPGPPLARVRRSGVLPVTPSSCRPSKRSGPGKLARPERVLRRQTCRHYSPKHSARRLLTPDSDQSMPAHMPRKIPAAPRSAIGAFPKRGAPSLLPRQIAHPRSVFHCHRLFDVTSKPIAPL